MIKLLTIVEYIVAVALTASVILQHRGTGLGGVFASEGNAYRSKRGVEKLLFNSTIVLGSLLAATALIHLYLRLKNLA